MKQGRWRTGTPVVQDAARRLRNEMTPAEAALWEALRRNGLDGLHFRRQHAVGRFVLDFYCASRGLCVEVDGEVHDAQADYDEARTAALALRGIRVVRFRNEDVLRNLPTVLERIRGEAAAANTSPDDEP